MNVKNTFDVPLKIGDKVEVLSKKEIDENKKINGAQFLSDEAYENFRKRKNLTIHEVTPVEDGDWKGSLLVRVTGPLINGTSILYYPLEIRLQNQFVIELL